MDITQKQTWVIGNWKSNPATLQIAKDLSTEIVQRVSTKEFLDTNQIMIMPSTLHLTSVLNQIQDSNISVGCQDISYISQTTGAYTGDCSAQQMHDIGVNWTLVGHSERREYYSEDDKILIAKIENTFEQGLGVVLCVGESLEEYEGKQTIAVLESQLRILTFIEKLQDNFDKLIIAYEPIWAIGTGKIPSIDEVENVHEAINNYLVNIDTKFTNTPILYGGSVNPDNAELFANSKWVNGALIGGASLVANKFVAIADIFFSTKSKLLINK